ncbi:MAG: hypothetical protein IIC90_12405 [Chloroflexi bacterium]|nr:hypothetical protein [Chloroflexota bacterium]
MSIRMQSKPGRLATFGIVFVALAAAIVFVSQQIDTAQSSTDGAAMSISAAPAVAIECPATKVSNEVCVGFDSKLIVTVNVDAYDLALGYAGVAAYIFYGTGAPDDLVFKTMGINAAVPNDDGQNTGMSANILFTDFPLVGGVTGSALTALIPRPDGTRPNLMYKGPVLDFSFTYTSTASSHSIVLQNVGDDPAAGNGSAIINPDASANVEVTVGDKLLVNCVPPPTATPTSTPPPIPKMSKLPALQNVFLTRQNGKIPPASCGAGTNVGGLSEVLSQGIVSADPKGQPGDFQQLAAFEFEVHYDATKVCVDLTEGAEWTAAGAICFIEDSVSKPQLEGVARIGCLTPGKSTGDPEGEFFHEAIDDGAALAQIDVRPQPDVYSQAKPNQDNGVVVQINNVDCDLSDEQGHAIPIFSCDDADITFRYLEGDVDADCDVDADDAQAIAFRWGSEKGSLVYKDFMNLEPSGTQSDNDIDINDLQFVFGRFGSDCDDPHPDQDPVNPKA